MAGEVVSWAENAVCPSTDHDLLMRSFINQDSSWAEYAVCPSTDHDLLTRSFIISRQPADHNILGAPQIFAKQCLRDVLY